MKEKMKYFLEMLQTKRSKKIILIFVIFVVLFYSSLYIYSSLYQQEKMAIDRYNFNQLVIFKSIVKTHNYSFNNIKDFNEKFNQNITPIKNCYFLSNKKYYFDSKKGDNQYIFGFKLESLMYKFLYLGEYYAYPKYSLVYNQICYGVCDDRNRIKFEYIISNPCEK